MPLSELIESLIEKSQAARVHRALPVYADADGSLFLKSNGEVWFQSSDGANAPLKREESPHWCLVARLAAAERFPELAELVPVRSAAAVNCSDCDGSGHVLNGLVRCGVCYGLGWSEAPSNT